MADPGLASTSDGCSARVSMAAARRFTSRTSSHASSSIMVTGTAPAIPAAWTSPPMVPSSARHFLTAAFSPAALGDVDLEPAGLHAEFVGAASSGPAGGGAVAIPDGHGPPDLGQSQGGGQADARCATGDHDGGPGR